MKKRIKLILTHFDLVLKSVVWVGVAAGFAAIAGFVENRKNEQLCNGLDIKIRYGNGMQKNRFIEITDIQNLVLRQIGSPTGKPIGMIGLEAIENAVRKNPLIEKAEVYSTVDGNIRIEIEQRMPLLRIMTYQGYSYYMDDRGGYMPLSPRYTARVPLVNGYIFRSDTILHRSLYAVGKWISQEPFMRGLINQIYVNQDQEMEFVPRVGNFRIIFGDTAALEDKFHKLALMYSKGLPHAGWNRYSAINLKYKNQVVCTKR